MDAQIYRRLCDPDANLPWLQECMTPYQAHMTQGHRKLLACTLTSDCCKRITAHQFHDRLVRYYKVPRELPAAAPQVSQHILQEALNSKTRLSHVPDSAAAVPRALPLGRITDKGSLMQLFTTTVSNYAVHFLGSSQGSQAGSVRSSVVDCRAPDAPTLAAPEGGEQPFFMIPSDADTDAKQQPAAPDTQHTADDHTARTAHSSGFSEQEPDQALDTVTMHSSGEPTKDTLSCEIEPATPPGMEPVAEPRHVHRTHGRQRGSEAAQRAASCEIEPAAQPQHAHRSRSMQRGFGPPQGTSPSAADPDAQPQHAHRTRRTQHSAELLQGATTFAADPPAHPPAQPHVISRLAPLPDTYQHRPSLAKPSMYFRNAPPEQVVVPPACRGTPRTPDTDVESPSDVKLDLLMTAPGSSAQYMIPSSQNCGEKNPPPRPTFWIRQANSDPPQKMADVLNNLRYGFKGKSPLEQDTDTENEQA